MASGEFSGLLSGVSQVFPGANARHELFADFEYRPHTLFREISLDAFKASYSERDAQIAAFLNAFE